MFCHLFVIAVALAFESALNETGRDSDVYRMFSRGHAFKATKLCVNSLFFGITMMFVAVMVVYYDVLGIEGLLSVCLSMGLSFLILYFTSSGLMNSCSIHSYWRGDYGSTPDEGD